MTGWFASDFTLAEIRTLRAIAAAAPSARPVYNGQFKIPTLDEVLDLARKQSRKRGRPIGVYPETKHPTFHAQLGLPLERPLVARSTATGSTTPTTPVYIQSLRAVEPEGAEQG